MFVSVQRFREKHLLEGSMNSNIGQMHSDYLTKEKIENSSHSCHCGKSYVHYNSLWRHKKYECGKEPQFHCPLCASKYTQKSTLDVHIRLKHPFMEDIISTAVIKNKTNCI